MVTEKKKKTEAQREDTRHCPIDRDILMKEDYTYGGVIYRCPSCGGVWLEPGQLEKIEESIFKRGFKSGWMAVPPA